MSVENNVSLFDFKLKKMGNKKGNIFFLKIWNIMLIFGKVFGNHISHS